MPKVSLKGQGEITKVMETLKNKFSTKFGMSCSLVDEVHRQIGNSDLYVMVFEKYYARASNRVSLTISVCAFEDEVMVDAISSGGGQGAFFKFSWGAEDDFLDGVEQALREYNFEKQ